MRIFISWSGDSSRAVAKALDWWLPKIFPHEAHIVLSLEFDKGRLWGPQLVKELRSCAFGIVCVTRDNLTAPWLNYEAGALSMTGGASGTVGDAAVCPVLHGVDKKQVEGPLSHLQMSYLDKDEVLLLVTAVNRACEHPLSEQRLKVTFEDHWPMLQERLAHIPVPEYLVPDTSASHDPQSRRIQAAVVLLDATLDLLRAHHRDVKYRAMVTKADPNDGTRLTWCGVGLFGAMAETRKVPMYFGFTGEALQTGKTKTGEVDDNNRNAAPDGTRVHGVWRRLRSVVAIPMATPEGQVIGTVNFDSDAELNESGMADKTVLGALEQVAETLEYLLLPAITPVTSERVV